MKSVSIEQLGLEFAIINIIAVRAWETGDADAREVKAKAVIAGCKAHWPTPAVSARTSTNSAKLLLAAAGIDSTVVGV